MYIMYMIALVVSAISLTLSATTSHNLKHETTRGGYMRSLSTGKGIMVLLGNMVFIGNMVI